MRDILRMKMMLRFFRDRETSWNIDPYKITEDLLSSSWSWDKHQEFRQPDWHKNADYSFNNLDVRAQNNAVTEAKKVIRDCIEHKFIDRKGDEIFLETSGRWSANSWIIFFLYVESRLNKLVLVAGTLIIVSVLTILFWYLLLSGRIALRGLADFVCDKIPICVSTESRER